MDPNLCDKIIYYTCTIGIYCIFFLKTTLNTMIGYLLGIIVAVGVVLDYDSTRKGYIALTLVIIFCLALDRHIRAISKSFDMISTIFGPINASTSMRKIIHYKKSNYTLLMLFLALVEIIKILSGVYCVIILIIVVQNNVFVNYCLFALLFLESGSGLILYLIIAYFTITKKDFYPEWIEWMGKWYLHDSVKCTVMHIDSVVILEFKAKEYIDTSDPIS